MEYAQEKLSNMKNMDSESNVWKIKISEKLNFLKWR